MNDSKRRFTTWMSYLSDIGAHFHHDTEQEAFDMLTQDKENEGRVFFVSELQPHERIFTRDEIRNLMFEAVSLLEEYQEQFIADKLNELFAGEK